MLYLGQSNWPERGKEKKKIRNPTSIELPEKQVKISFGHRVTTVLVSRRQGPPSVCQIEQLGTILFESMKSKD